MIRIYEKTTCTTCRRLVELLEQEGVPFERIDYMIDPLPRGALEVLLRKGGLSARSVLREKDARAAGVDPEALSEGEVLDLLAARPELLQRPLVERGDRVVLARPPERVRDLF